MNQTELRTSLEKLHIESFGWAVRCCFGDRTAAEDVLQTVYLKILEGKAQFKGKSDFKTWLFSVIRNTAIDYLKMEKRLKNITTERLDFESVSEKANSENEVFLIKALRELSPQQSQILHLVFYQNLTIWEAAEIMDIQIGTARTHYERGKGQLKKRLLMNQNFQK